MEVSNELNELTEYIYSLVLETNNAKNNRIIPSIKTEQIYCILKKAKKEFTTVDLIYLTEIINLKIQVLNCDNFSFPKQKQKKDIFI